MRITSLIAVGVAIALAGCAANTDTTYADGFSAKSRLAPLESAQQLQGKDARRDRHELKRVMASGNTQPVDPATTPWCAGFMNAMLARNGWSTTQSLQARSFLRFGTKTASPEDGDIVVLRRGRNGWSGHVGFFMGYEYYDGTKYVKVLGGNTERKVDIGYFPVNRVLGYRRLDETVPASVQPTWQNPKHFVKNKPRQEQLAYSRVEHNTW
jgi:uncharacterized protein (TIGR02594 family)